MRQISRRFGVTSSGWPDKDHRGMYGRTVVPAWRLKQAKTGQSSAH